MPVSSKNIPDKERLIVALDVDSRERALSAVKLLGDSAWFYKIGLQLFMSGEYFELLNDLAGMNKKVFVDLKFYDVPETVAKAVRRLSGLHKAAFVTVHGYGEILRAAAKEKGDMRVLAVTVLTSLDQADIERLGYKADLSELVRLRARNAVETGCDGVIASGREAKSLRIELGDEPLIVTPGIRPIDYAVADDQKRTVGPKEAFINGADYIVVGRPILASGDPKGQAEQIQKIIAEVFSGGAG